MFFNRDGSTSVTEDFYVQNNGIIAICTLSFITDASSVDMETVSTCCDSVFYSGIYMEVESI